MAGAAAGASSSAYASAIQGIGNAIVFGDPFSIERWAQGVAFGALTGGVLNGFSATFNGRNFWNGKLLPKNFRVQPLAGQVRFQTPQEDNIAVPKTASGSPPKYDNGTRRYLPNSEQGFAPPEPTFTRILKRQLRLPEIILKR